MAYPLAIVFAVVVGLIEQHTRLGHRVTLEHRAWLWYGGRMVLEAIFACLALAIAQSLDVKYSDKWFAGFAAWFVGGSAARSSAARPRRKGRDIPIGLEFFFDAARNSIEGRLDRIGSNAEGRFREHAVPLLARTGATPESFGGKLVERVEGLETLREADKTAGLRAIRADIRDEASGNEARLNVLIQRAQRLGQNEFLDDAVLDAERAHSDQVVPILVGGGVDPGALRAKLDDQLRARSVIVRVRTRISLGRELRLIGDERERALAALVRRALRLRLLSVIDELVRELEASD